MLEQASRRANASSSQAGQTNHTLSKRAVTPRVILTAAAAIALFASATTVTHAARWKARSLPFLVKQVSQTAPDPAFPRPGDVVVAAFDNVWDGQTIGRDATSCVVVDTAANFECSTTIGLPGATLQAAFSQNASSTTITGAIIGGTGRYASAGGYFVLRRINSTSFVARLHLR